MTQMTDIMVDVETTGTNPHTAAIIQLSAIKFNLDTREVGGFFDRYPAPLPFRAWSDGTRDFWMKHPEVYGEIMSKQEPALPVFQSFFRWVTEDEPNGGYRFWAKPVTFDWPLVASHMEQCDLPMPFHYRIARDVNSFAAGLKANPEHPAIDEGIIFKGKEHNALHDCGFQIDCLFDVSKRFVPTEIVQ